MTQPTLPELERLAQATAHAVYGADAVNRVAVEEREDQAGEPAYYFTFAFKDPPATARAGRRADLGLRLLDALRARGDTHFPYTRFVEPDRWDEFVRD